MCLQHAAAALLSLSVAATAESLPAVQLVEAGPGYARLLFQGPAPGDLPAPLTIDHLRHFSHSALLGIPLEGDVTLTVLEARARGQVEGPLPSDIAVAGPAWLEAPAFLRHQRVVAVGFGPAAGAQGAVVYDRVLVEVRFSPPSSVAVPPLDPFEPSYRATLINYEQSRLWRRARTTAAARRAQSGQVLPEDGMFRLTVRSNGLYRVSGEDLEAAGADLRSIDPERIRLLYGGGGTLGLSPRVSDGVLLNERPLVVDGGDDGRFDRDDALLFYGEAVERWDYSNSAYYWRKNLFTRDNAYWIDLQGSAAPLRAEHRSGANDRTVAGAIGQYRERIHEEDERLILRQLEGINSGYDWYWDVFNGNARNFTFAVNDAVQGVPAAVRVAFFGWTNEAHLFDLRWNDADLGRRVFTTSSPDTISATAAEGAIEGLNQLGVFHRDLNTTRLDWYEVDYVRRLVARGGELVFDWPDAEDGGVVIDTTDGAVAQFELAGFDADNGAPRLFEVSGNLREIVDFDYDPATGSVRFQDWFSGKGRAPRYIASQPIRWKRPAAITRDSQTRLRDPSIRAEYVLISHADFLPAARRLGAWRATDDRFGEPLRTLVVDVQDIYDEFSGGLVDPMAIRAFVNYAVDNWATPPVYICLMGDGTYDYKNNSGVSHTNWMPPYQDGESTYDEWYVRVEGEDRTPDAAIGRLTVQSLAEADAVVDKIINYDRDPETGIWQSQVLLVADDISNPQIPSQFEAYFLVDAEFMARGDMPEDLDLTKLYIGTYELEGRTKPRARDEFLRLFNKGALIFTYLGHGNPEVLAHEQIFLLSRDIGRIDNGRRLPFVYTAASQVGVFDDPNRESMPETLVKKPDGGAIGFISATRVGFHNSNVLLARRFHRLMYRSGRSDVPMGLALMEAKQLEGLGEENRTNVQRYSLIGDPAQRLNRPRLQVQLEVPDSLEALMLVDVSGQVLGMDGQPRTDYQGWAVVRAFDSSAASQIEGLPYEQLGAPMFRARVEVVNGRFETKFRVPKDITYRANRGRVSAYVLDAAAVEPAFGARTGLVLQGTAANVGVDAAGPDIAIGFSGQSGFRDGDFVASRATLAANLSDANGINITGETGHEIELWLDDAEVTAVTEFFTSLVDHTQGVVEFPLGTLEPGEHSIRLKAWDTFNNSSEAAATFVVAEAQDAALAGVLFHPNPMTNGAGHFIYTLTAPTESVLIQVYALSGRRVASVTGDTGLGYNQVSWTPGDLANGTYLYQLEARLVSGGSVRRDGRVQVMR